MGADRGFPEIYFNTAQNRYSAIHYSVKIQIGVHLMNPVFYADWISWNTGVCADGIFSKDAEL